MSRLCQSCWDYWKKYGGFKTLQKYETANLNEEAKKKSTLTATVSSTTPVVPAVVSVPPLAVVSSNTSSSTSGPLNAVSGGVALNEEEKVNDLSNRQLHKYVKINFC